MNLSSSNRQQRVALFRMSVTASLLVVLLAMTSTAEAQTQRLVSNPDAPLGSLAAAFGRRLDTFKLAAKTLGQSYLSDGRTCAEAAAAATASGNRNASSNFLQTALALQQGLGSDVIYTYVSFALPGSGGAKFGDCGCVSAGGVVSCYYIDPSATYHEFTGATFRRETVVMSDASTESFEYTQNIRAMTRNHSEGIWMKPYLHVEPTTGVAYQLVTYSVPLAFDSVTGRCVLSASIDVGFAAVQRWLAASRADINGEILLLHNEGTGTLIASSVAADIGQVIAAPDETASPRINRIAKTVKGAMGGTIAFKNAGSFIADGLLHRVLPQGSFTFIERAPLSPATKSLAVTIDDVLQAYELATEALGRSYTTEGIACYDIGATATTSEFLHTVNALQQAYGTQLAFAYVSTQLPSSTRWVDCGCSFVEGKVACNYIDRSGVEYSFSGASLQENRQTRADATTESFAYTQVIANIVDTGRTGRAAGVWHAPYIYIDPSSTGGSKTYELMTYTIPLVFDKTTKKCTTAVSIDVSLSIFNSLLSWMRPSKNATVVLVHSPPASAPSDALFVAASEVVQLGGTVFKATATPNSVINDVASVAASAVAEANLYSACYSSRQQQRQGATGGSLADEAWRLHRAETERPCHVVFPQEGGSWLYHVEMSRDSLVVIVRSPISDAKMPIDAFEPPGVAPSSTGRAEMLIAAADTLAVRAISWAQIAAALNISYALDKTTPPYNVFTAGRKSLPFLQHALAVQETYRGEIVFAYVSYAIPNSGGQWGDAGCGDVDGTVMCHITLANGSHVTFRRTNFGDVVDSDFVTTEGMDYTKAIMNLTRADARGVFLRPYAYTDPGSDKTFQLVTFTIPQDFDPVTGRCILAISIDVDFSHFANRMADFKATPNTEIVFYDTRGDGTLIASSEEPRLEATGVVSSLLLNPNPRLQGFFSTIAEAQKGDWNLFGTFSRGGMSYTVIPLMGIWAIAQRTPNDASTSRAATSIGGLFESLMAIGFSAGKAFENQQLAYCSDVQAELGSSLPFLHFLASLQSVDSGATIAYAYVSRKLPNSAQWVDCGCFADGTGSVMCNFVNRDGVEVGFSARNLSQVTSRRPNAFSESYEYTQRIAKMTRRDAVEGVFHAPSSYFDETTQIRSELVTWSYPLGFDGSGSAAPCNFAVSVDITLNSLSDDLAMFLISPAAHLIAVYSDPADPNPTYLSGTQLQAQGRIYSATATPSSAVNSLTRAGLTQFGSLNRAVSTSTGSQLINADAFGGFSTRPFAVVGSTPVALVEQLGGTWAPLPTSAASVPRCPSTNTVFTVFPGAQNAVAFDPALDSCVAPTAVVSRAPPSGTLTITSGLQLVFFTAADAPSGQVVAEIDVSCSGAVACRSALVFNVRGASNGGAASPAPGAVPLPLPLPPTPTTKTQCAAMPNAPYIFSVKAGSQLRQQLAAPSEASASCGAVVFRRPAADAIDTNQRFVTNIIGEFLYAAPAEEVTESYVLDVYCLQTFVCQIRIEFRVVASGVTPQPAATRPLVTATPAPTLAPIDECPNVYYFYATPTVPLSSTLRDRQGELPCAVGRSFALIRQVSIGRLSTMTLRGDFIYESQVEDRFADFGFSMLCAGKVVCQGSAYIVVSKSAVPAPTPPPGATPSPFGPSTPAPPTTPAPPVFVSTDALKCSGTCNADAWKAMPQFPEVWDDTPDERGGFSHVTPRADGKPLNGIDVRWNQGTLLLTAFGKVGNVAARFPTFERVDFKFGDRFTASELKSRIASSSTGFDQDCLANQPNSGIAAEVWRVTSKENKTGFVGSNYASGASWYHKFGGKHINCDTFVKSCRYAPLLTPNRMQDDVGNQLAGTWQVEVSDCDVTWRGSFPYNALTQMKRRDGTPVWQYVGPRQLSATVFSQVVKPDNWLEPARGVATRVTSHPLTFDLQGWARASSNDGSNPPFTLGVQYFDYVDDVTRDKAFGLNLLVFPVVPEGATTSYLADRHVMGFTWKQFEWRAPSIAQCPFCTGGQFNCTAPDGGRGGLLSDEFPSGTCSERARVVLKKGPSTARDACPIENPMHVYDRPGFSRTVACRTSYQNLTIRGVAPGSHNAPNSFAFEGFIEILLQLDNGNVSSFNVDLALFVSRLSTSNINGSMDICRASPYWPVYDPLGVSTPDRPHELSTTAPGYLCMDRLDRDFGPTGWALIAIDVEGVPADRVRVDSLFVTYPEATAPIVLVDAAARSSSAAVASWKMTHPYLNFRDLRGRLGGNATLPSSPDVDPIAPPDAAFMLTPGAIGIRTSMEITAIVTVFDESGKNVIGQVTLRQNVMAAPKLTATSRFGPAQLAETIETTDVQSENFFALGIAAGVIAAVFAVGIFYIATDNDRPLPKWIPRGKLLKKTLFSVVPIQGMFSAPTTRGSAAAAASALPAELRLDGSPYAAAVRTATKA